MSLVKSPDPPRGRHRSCTAASARHCAFAAVGSYNWSVPVYWVPAYLPGVEHPAALVEEVANLEGVVQRQPGGVAATPAGFAGDDVVAGVPDDGVVVRQHAQGVGCRPLPRVDVVDVVAGAVGVERVLVEAQVVRPAVLHRRGARVVLGRHDQHVVVGFLDGLVGERLARLTAAFEPDLDAVARFGSRDESAHGPVVHAGLAAVALAAGPLLGRHGDRGVAVDGVPQRHVAQAALGDDAHLLRVAVGVVEGEVHQGQPVLVGVVALQVEGLGRRSRGATPGWPGRPPTWPRRARRAGRARTPPAPAPRRRGTRIRLRSAGPHPAPASTPARPSASARSRWSHRSSRRARRTRGPGSKSGMAGLSRLPDNA